LISIIVTSLILILLFFDIKIVKPIKSIKDAQHYLIIPPDFDLTSVSVLIGKSTTLKVLFSRAE